MNPRSVRFGRGRVTAFAFSVMSLIAAGMASACGTPRDAAEIGVSTKPPPPDAGRAPGGYDYVADRPLGSVGLAEHDGFSDAEGHALVDAVANELERCAATFLKEGHLARGAVRVEALVDDAGHLASVDVKVSPGEDATKNAVLCVITPTRQFPFSSGKRDGGAARRFAIEAVWQPLGG